MGASLMSGLSRNENNIFFTDFLSFVLATTSCTLNGVTVAGGHGQGNASHLLNRPRGLCMDREDKMVVADSENHRLIEWKRGATSGRVLAGGNGKGNRPDQLNLPSDVIIDKETDSLIICDAGNHRVTRWSRRSGTQTGETIIDQIDCFGLAMDNHGSLYVTDTGKDEVRRYPKGETRGIVVAGKKGQGTGLNQLNTPRYVCVDDEQAVYVSDTKNHRVIKWVKDAKEGIIVAGGNGTGKDLNQLSHPQGVLVDAAGTVYVADFVNDRIMRWYRGASQGSVVAGGHGRADGVNQLYHPSGLSFDREGMLYVADYGNHRVQRFLIDQN